MIWLALGAGLFSGGALFGREWERMRPGRTAWDLALGLAMLAAFGGLALLLHADL